MTARDSVEMTAHATAAQSATLTAQGAAKAMAHSTTDVWQYSDNIVAKGIENRRIGIWCWQESK